MNQGRYLYAIIRHSGSLDARLRGFHRLPLSNLGYHEIGAVVSETPNPLPTPTRENLLLHEGLVESLMTDFPLLPARFGTILPSEGKVAALLARHYSSLLERLQAVVGRVEMGVKVLWREGNLNPGPDPLWEAEDLGPGSRYLLRRLQVKASEAELRQRAETLAQEIHPFLERHAVQSLLRILSRPRLLIDASYLVDRERVELFQEEVKVLPRRYPQLRFLCSGPWPPYSFSDLELRREG